MAGAYAGGLSGEARTSATSAPLRSIPNGDPNDRSPMMSKARLSAMYGSNCATDRAEKVWATSLRLRLCSARSRELKRPRWMETKAS
ncbi:hypothetical protein CDD83_6214 [Cordyceps sp. RAO-2017]|nr:hypothetical protein CDD83_6214 [Cordyceps sp. RAO-2017]